MKFTKKDAALFEELFNDEPNLDTIKKMVANGANINAIDPETDNTVLMEAVEMLEEDELHVLQTLLDLGADVNQEIDGLNPLVLAIYEQKPIIAEFLLKNKANPNYEFDEDENVVNVAYDVLEEFEENKENTDKVKQIIALLEQYGGKAL